MVIDFIVFVEIEQRELIHEVFQRQLFIQKAFTP